MAACGCKDKKNEGWAIDNTISGGVDFDMNGQPDYLGILKTMGFAASGVILETVADKGFDAIPKFDAASEVKLGVKLLAAGYGMYRYDEFGTYAAIGLAASTILRYLSEEGHVVISGLPAKFMGIEKPLPVRDWRTPIYNRFNETISGAGNSYPQQPFL